MVSLIERTRMAASILRDLGGQSAMTAAVDEAADALEAAWEDAAILSSALLLLVDYSTEDVEEHGPGYNLALYTARNLVNR